MPLDLNTLVNPPFAKDPPVKVDIDAKILGIVVAILSGLGILFGLGLLIGLMGIGAVLARYGFGGFLPLAYLGALVILAADIMSLMGGWRMYQGDREGKRLVIYGLAIGFVGQIIYGLGYASIGSVILPLVVLAIVYYLVVVSRFPGEAPTPPTTSTPS